MPRLDPGLGLDVLVSQKDGTVRRLTQAGMPGAIDLPRLAGELYASARCLRVFTASRVDATAAVTAELLTA